MDSYCYLTVTKRGIIIESTYDVRFVEELKTLIPHTARTWDPVEKKWTVDAAYTDDVKRLACNYYDRVWLLEGGITTDLKTGETVNPMFEAGV